MSSQENTVSFFSEWTVIISTVIIVCIFVTYRFLIKNNDYFSKRNVPYLKPTILLGNFGPILMKKVAISDSVIQMYRELDKHPVAGVFQFLTPLYFIRDPELIKQVTIKDFEHFVDLPVFIPEDVEPILTKNLQALKGQKWKEMRSTLSPAFTSNKMKMMLVLIAEICQQLTKHIESDLHKRQTSSQQASDGDPMDLLPMDVKELFRKFTNDVIATAAFGIHCDTLQDPNNDFYKMGKDFMDFSYKGLVILFAYRVVPKFMKLMKFTLVPKKIAEFFQSLVRDSIQVREKEGIVRPDMIHLLMQVRDNNMFEEDSNDGVHDSSNSSINQNTDKAKKMSLGIDDIAAQALVFFTAGFELIALLLSFTTVLFAKHQDIQQRVRDEIDEVLKENDNQINYETIQKMKLLDCFISETLRLYPPAPALSRKCVKDFKIPNTDFTIEKDIGILIPVNGLHHDPEYFPDPEVFNPDRFNDENKHKIQQCTYMPFGSGPRQCIANRFALMETKAALVHLLKQFELHPISKTKFPIRLTKSLQLGIEGGFCVGFKLRSDKK